MATAADIRSQVTAQIIAALEGDLVPWRRPWRVSINSGRPTSIASTNPYTGVNPLLLDMHSLQHGFRSKWWGTFDQWRRLGLKVKPRPKHVEPGCWGTKIVFYKPICKTIVDAETGEETKDDFRILRTWSVFNADQVDGNGAERFQVVEEPGPQPELADFEPARELLDATGADIRHEGSRAYYRRPTPENTWPNHSHGDFVVLPPRHTFVAHGAYYETAFHELGHWSEVRLDWDFRSHGYAACELVAEIAACHLSAELGVPNGESLENHARYVKDWLSAMRGDASFVFRAATQASKVTDFLLSFVRQPASEQQAEAVKQAA